ncbi:MAG TPA: hypothetical protein EYG51_21685 [Pseudomonadales bacterium]|nr:hypothetical protein [Pseudomonadales bacterium]
MPTHQQFTLIHAGHDITDLHLLFWIFIIVAVSWILVGFGAGSTIMGADALSSLLPMLYQLTASGGDIQAMAYRTDMFGGMNYLGGYGILPLSVLLAKLQIPPLTSLNITFFLFHCCYCFLGVQAVFKWSREPKNFSVERIPTVVFLVMFIGFSPMLAYRINEGHQNLFLGLLLLQALLALWLCHRAGQLSMTVLLISLFSIVHGLSAPGFQMLVYGAVFAAPVFCSILFRQGNVKFRPLSLAVVLAVFLLACLLAAPVLFEMIAFAGGPDASRNMGGEVAIYTFLTNQMHDWFSALFWYRIPATGRPGNFDHEILYGVGPLLLMSFYVLASGRYLPFAGFLGSVFLCLVVSNNISPLSDLLLQVVPPLADFRVPARSVMPVILIWSCYVANCILVDVSRLAVTLSPVKPLLLAFAVAAAISFSSAASLNTASFKEILLWCIVAITCITLWILLRNMDLEEPASALTGTKIRASATMVMSIPIFGLLLIGLMSLLAFKSINQLEKSFDRVIDANRQLGETILRIHPELGQVLTRISIPTTDLLLSSAGGLPSINGYGFPLKSFSVTTQSLMEQPFSATRGAFDIVPENIAFPTLQQLYNICCVVEFEGDRVSVRDQPTTPGAIWTSVTIRVRTSEEQLLESLSASIQRSSDWHRVQYRRGEAEQTVNFSPDCDTLSFQVPVADEKMMVFGIENSGASECPVSVATTFASTLVVTVVNDGEFSRVETYTGNGSLLGFVMPAGTTGVIVESVSPVAPVANFVFWIGCLILFVILGEFIWDQRHNKRV